MAGDGSENIGQARANDKEVVAAEREEVRTFVRELSPHDISSGGWFTKLLTRSFAVYTKKVDAQYFQEKYRGLPPDIIVQQRIDLAAKYAAIEAGLSASAYSAAVVSTIGTLGGASPATVPAAAATMLVDLTYTTQLQLKLAYDISVLYGIPIDVDDPDDMWRLIRVAFTIKSGEVAGEGILKAVPMVVRPLIKKFYSKGVLNAAKGLPVVGKFLLQRNVIKVGIPLVGVPLAVVINRQTTLVAGRQARQIFRNEARIIEIAQEISDATRHPELLLWVALLVVKADGDPTEDEVTLLRHLARVLRDQHGVDDLVLSTVVDLKPDQVWQRIEKAQGNLDGIVDVGHRIAMVDGSTNSKEFAVLTELKMRCARKA